MISAKGRGNKMIVLLLALMWLVLLGGDSALATAQFPDVLIYEGKQYQLFSNPLESYYKAHGLPRPKFQAWHTANYRGYVATWEIDNDVLYLKKIRAKIDGHMVGLNYLFPDNSGKVEARWFQGFLRVPMGAVLHQGYTSVYERDLIITIKAGKVVGKEFIDNRDTLHQEK